MTTSTTHAVYEDGPNCNPVCPDERSEYHAIYAPAFMAGETHQSTLTLATLVRPVVIEDEYVDGPTKRTWFWHGVRTVAKQLGFRRVNKKPKK